MSAPNRYATAGRLGAQVKWGKTTDRAAATEAARRAARDRFAVQVRKEHPDLDEQTVQLMADARRREYFTRLAMKSAAARRRAAA